MSVTKNKRTARKLKHNMLNQIDEPNLGVEGFGKERMSVLQTNGQKCEAQKRTKNVIPKERLLTAV
jgi:hypothetical protein